MQKAVLFIEMLLCMCLLSCGIFKEVKEYFTKNPEVEAVEEVIKIAMPICYAAQIAMAAVAGEAVDPDITVISNVQDSSGGSALITIPITTSRPLPVGNKTGTIVVSGFWLSMNEAVMAMVLTNLTITTATATFDNIKAFPVFRDTTGVQAVYMKQWVNLGESSLDTNSVSESEAAQKKQWGENTPEINSSVSVEQDVWIVTALHKGTPGDPTDDEYGLVGVGQYAGLNHDEAYLVQLIMLGAAMKANCRDNPVVDNVFSGGALLNTYEVQSGSDPSSFPKIGRALFTYHSQCDGKIDLSFATGCYIGRIGQSYAIDLN